MSAGRHKGTGVAHMVGALRSHPRAHEVVPKHLAKYLEQNILVSGWYPDDDYFGLLATVAKAFDAKEFGGDPWLQMGVLGARRDIAGVETLVGPATAGHVGVYRQYACQEPDVALFFLRAAKLWTQYHHPGRYEIMGKVQARHSVIRRLVEYRVPLQGFMRLQVGYVQEYARLSNIEMTVLVGRSTAAGDPYCEWECKLTRTPNTEAYLASLPEFRP